MARPMRRITGRRITGTKLTNRPSRFCQMHGSRTLLHLLLHEGPFLEVSASSKKGERPPGNPLQEGVFSRGGEGGTRTPVLHDVNVAI